ncbi:RNA-directed DNA polymerase, eukaryota, reverse transcriptase zinc-binding domain protein [Tanacetum coccineum]
MIVMRLTTGGPIEDDDARCMEVEDEGEWVDYRGGAEGEQFLLLRSRVHDILLPQMCDRWVWSLLSLGEFLVKSVRKYIDDILLHKEPVHTRWVKVVPIKVNILAWKVWLDNLPTHINLPSRGLEIPSLSCPLCNV